MNTVGFIPEKCLNGQGRALGETSAWIDLKPADKRRVLSDYKIKMDDAGVFSGSASISHYGYAAVSQRYQYFSREDVKDYVRNRTEQWTDMETTDFTIENDHDLTKPFVEKFNLTAEDEAGKASVFYFPLFLVHKDEKNPFTSSERLYPVDFGAPVEYIYLLSMELPSTFTAEEIPKSMALSLPNAGGRFLFSSSILNNRLTVSSSFSLNKPLYTSEEYHALREIYSRYIAALQSVVVLRRK